MEPFKLAFSFVLGLGFVYLYYKNLWCYAKVEGRRLKLEAKFGRDNPKLERFKRRFSTRRCSRLVRILLLLVFLTPAYLAGGKEGLGTFLAAVIVGNLLLLVWFSLLRRPE
ncbi:MAG: hypothetical protein GXO08_01425 [Aquificae bacterium]|nr:hypothetical protein [Aquificota bacterium]